ncbi:MAG: DNA polymerase III subunit alpha [Flavisolibacter sp.]|nr:DNA polymerase III subunit alpha [Flavisolibacter sp.]
MYLNCKTYYSFLYGSFSTAQLVNAAADYGITSLALTNINTTYDIWEFVKLSRNAGIKPVLGAEVRNGDKLLYILIAANNTGLTWIHTFLSKYWLEKDPLKKHPVFPEPSEDLKLFEEAWDGFVIYPLGAKPLDQLLPHERIGIKPSELNKLFSLDWKPYADRLVIRQPVTIQNKVHYNLHRLLRCVDNNILLAQLRPDQCCEPDETFLSPDQLLQKFRQYPFIVTNTYKLLDACNIEMDFAVDKTKQVFGGSTEDDRILLEKLTWDGFKSRYGKKNQTAKDRVTKELKIINDLGFNSYFLINLDIVRYAQSRGFYHVGRGSGANSIVAYCLGITNVDPIRLNLYFERFLNPERTSPPDFDIDFSHVDRDEIFDYIFKRYGRQHVALLGSYPTFKRDKIHFELGKVFGLPEDEIEAMRYSNGPVDEITKLIYQYGKLMYGFPSNPSLHPCGILICEKPIRNYCTLFMPPKGFPTAMMDMFTAEDIGINKYDILSQRGLSHIRTAQQLIKEHHNVSINIHDTDRFMSDPLVARHIKNANTIGCFYIESPAMRQLLKKLTCDDYITLVAASSIIRPGVAQSGMMREYIHRYHHRDQIKYIHPLFEEHLGETFGVMVFQEDVIKIAHYYGGLSLGESDILRRAMSGKYRSNNQFLLIREKFIASAAGLGRNVTEAAEVWRQMESFGGYSFNKAHSASFAVESYMSLFLKTYYPREFMVAVINNFGGFYSSELYFIELLKTGAKISPPCVNNSEALTNIKGDIVYTGFVHVKDLRKDLLATFVEERERNGIYSDLQDFVRRVSPSLTQLEILISIGAFGFTGRSKKQLLWEANVLKPRPTDKQHFSAPLFEESNVTFQETQQTDHPLDDLYDQMEYLGFPLTNPFHLVDADPTEFVRAEDLPKYLKRTVTVLVYYVARKTAVTKNNDQMYFGTFLDHDLNWIDTVHFPNSAKNYPLHTAGFYRITGRVTEDFGVFSLEAHKMEKVAYKQRSYAEF